MLWLALHFPLLPLEIFQRGRDTASENTNGHAVQPLTIVTTGSRPAVLLADTEASRLGIRPGMSLSAAYALAPDLVVHPRDSAQEATSLEAIARWAGQFTPTLCIDVSTVLLLEIGGCLKLFDGLDALIDRIRRGIAELGFDAMLACAPTATAAGMLSRSGLELQITDHASLRQRIGQLPVDSLDEAPGTLDTLRRLGLHTLHDCLRLPRDGLARRFGQSFVDRIDRALGHLPDPRVPFVPPARFSSRLVLPVPVPQVEQVLFGARRLVTELTGFLLGRGAGVTRLTCLLEHEDRPATAVEIELSMPNRDAAHLSLLLRERLSRQQLPAPVEAIVLQCTETMQLAPRNFSFFATRESATEERTALVERLRARLGKQAVHGLVLVPEHRPELAFREAEPGTSSTPPMTAPRPLWLLHSPRPIDPRTLRLTGSPERIESGWWDGNDIQRDYYSAITPEDTHLWVYREINHEKQEERWYVHGEFA